MYYEYIKFISIIIIILLSIYIWYWYKNNSKYSKFYYKLHNKMLPTIINNNKLKSYRQLGYLQDLYIGCITTTGDPDKIGPLNYIKPDYQYYDMINTINAYINHKIYKYIAFTTGSKGLLITYLGTNIPIEIQQINVNELQYDRRCYIPYDIDNVGCYSKSDGYCPNSTNETTWTIYSIPKNKIII